MKYKIESLKLEEVEVFWRVFGQILGTEFPGYTPKVVNYFLEKIYTKHTFFYWITNHIKTVLAVKKDFEIIGFAVIDEPYGGVSFCRWLGIKKEYQKKGIGKSLIKNWINLAKTQKCHKVEVAGQPEAKGFYLKIGLELEGFRKLSYFGINQYMFGKVIGKVDDNVMIQVKF